VKLHVSGYKFIKYDVSGKTIKLFNMNNSLFKTVTIPSTITVTNLSYVSENLFDLDNGLEFALASYNFPARLQIVDETGTVLMTKDSAILVSSGWQPYENNSGIISDGNVTKMILRIQSSQTSDSRIDIYDLPGSLTCQGCSPTGTVTAISRNEGENGDDASFYPNPVTENMKLKYTLPHGCTEAVIKVHDTQGRLVGDFTVTNDFDSLILPSSYNNGLYLYTLIVAGKPVKTEKIVLSR
jgi:hypothetical protein